MHLHSPDIEPHQFTDLLQAVVLVMPQRENRALPRRQFIKRPRQPRLDLAGKDVGIRRRLRVPLHIEDHGFVLRIRPPPPNLPLARSQTVQARIDSDPRDPFAKIVHLPVAGFLESLERLEKTVLRGGIGIFTVLQHAQAEQKDPFLLGGHPGTEFPGADPRFPGRFETLGHEGHHTLQDENNGRWVDTGRPRRRGAYA